MWQRFRQYLPFSILVGQKAEDKNKKIENEEEEDDERREETSFDATPGLLSDEDEESGAANFSSTRSSFRRNEPKTHHRTASNVSGVFYKKCEIAKFHEISRNYEEGTHFAKFREISKKGHILRNFSKLWKISKKEYICEISRNFTKFREIFFLKNFFSHSGQQPPKGKFFKRSETAPRSSTSGGGGSFGSVGVSKAAKKQQQKRPFSATPRSEGGDAPNSAAENLTSRLSRRSSIIVCLIVSSEKF